MLPLSDWRQAAPLPKKQPRRSISDRICKVLPGYLQAAVRAICPVHARVPCRDLLQQSYVAAFCIVYPHRSHRSATNEYFSQSGQYGRYAAGKREISQRGQAARVSVTSKRPQPGPSKRRPSSVPWSAYQPRAPAHRRRNSDCGLAPPLKDPGLRA